MFHPLDRPMERGWVGRVDGESVVHLASQTLQSLFTGGGSAREHAVYPLAEVRLLAPVLHPPSVRVFDDQESFVFANPAAILGPGADALARRKAPGNGLPQGGLTLFARVAGVIGAEGAIAGFTALADWRDPTCRPPKDRDFALGLGPFVLTSDELDPDGVEAAVRVDGRERVRGTFREFDWSGARDFAADGTTLYPGDLLVRPGLDPVEGISAASRVELEVEGIGALDHIVARR